MYGTVARLRIKPGMEAKLDEVMRSYEKLGIDGLIDEWVYKSDDDPRTYYLAVRFENRDKYVKNAESPEQDKRYRQMRELLEADPEWHDGEIIYAPEQSSGRRRAAA